MNVKIWPHKPGDGGTLCMPMKKNIPVGREDWKLVTCPVCGEECWETDLHRQARAEEPGLRAACTMCALFAGFGGSPLVTDKNVGRSIKVDDLYDEDGQDIVRGAGASDKGKSH